MATNLAYALAYTGQKVAVVDCDMRVPSIHEIFKLPNKLGLSNILVQGVDLDSVLQESAIPGVHVLTSGPRPRSPSELLGSYQMTTLINQLRQRFDTILFDSPSILSVTDPAVLAPNVDGVILVVCRARARAGEVKAACSQLAYVKARILGTVINRGEHVSRYYEYDPKSKPFRR